jgi:cytoskeleton protein RodZ
MATVAEQLRQAREEQKLNVYQVAEITKIKTDHIRALEAGSYDSFSAPVYIRGFVRTYAKALKLDIAKVTADLEGELSKSEKFSEPPPLMQKKGRALDFLMLQLTKLNWRVVASVAGVAVVVALVFIGLRSCSHRPKADPLKSLGPGLYRAKPGESGEKLPVPPAPRKQ